MALLFTPLDTIVPTLMSGTTFVGIITKLVA